MCDIQYAFISNLVQDAQFNMQEYIYKHLGIAYLSVKRGLKTKAEQHPIGDENMTLVSTNVALTYDCLAMSPSQTESVHSTTE